MTSLEAARSRDWRRTTAPAVLLARAQAEPHGVALRVKLRGLYVERSWRDLALRVAALAGALAARGFARGDRLAIMGDACEAWLVADLACQALGGISYGIYPTASAAELCHQMADGGASVFVAEDQEYVDRVLAVAARLPALQAIVVIDTTALFAYDDARLVEFDALVAPARDPARAATLLEALAARVALVGPDDPAFIVYTSGTTGQPKGALIAHGRHLAGCANLIAHYPLLGRAGLRTVVYLPLCHVLGRDIAITLPLLGGPVPHFGESVQDLPATLFEVAPDVLFTVPRYLQKFASQVLIGVGNSSALKRRVFALALAVARRQAAARWEGRVGLPQRLAYALARQGALRPVLNKLGFVRLRLVLCGGAPLPADTARFWQMFGVDVCEIYGQTETAGAIISGQRSPFPRPGDVGPLAEGMALKLAAAPALASGDGPGDAVAAFEPTADAGEIMLRTDYRFEGYWNHREASAQLFDAEGWLRTGDVGALEQGRLRLVDRARDFFVTAGGKTLSPTAIENAFRASPYIAEVVAIGHARKYVSALVEIDYDAVADWARARNLVHGGFTGLTEHPEVVALIGQQIDAGNRQLARVEQVKAYRILPKALDPEEEGEPVTPTRKVKRARMIERFAPLVESMYDGSEERLLRAAAG